MQGSQGRLGWEGTLRRRFQQDTVLLFMPEAGVAPITLSPCRALSLWIPQQGVGRAPQAGRCVLCPLSLSPQIWLRAWREGRATGAPGHGGRLPLSSVSPPPHKGGCVVGECGFLWALGNLSLGIGRALWKAVGGKVWKINKPALSTASPDATMKPRPGSQPPEAYLAFCGYTCPAPSRLFSEPQKPGNTPFASQSWWYCRDAGGLGRSMWEERASPHLAQGPVICP